MRVAPAPRCLRSHTSALVTYFTWSSFFNVNPDPKGGNYYVAKGEQPSVLTANAFRSAYVVQDFDGNEMDPPRRVAPGTTFPMAKSEAGAKGSPFDMFAGRSNMYAGVSIAHTVATVFDVKAEWKVAPVPTAAASTKRR